MLVLLFSTWFTESIVTVNKSRRTSTGNTFLPVLPVKDLTFLVSYAWIICLTRILTSFLNAYQLVWTVSIKSTFWGWYFRG